ncbi:arsenate reductase/protein-tyrosine-phosphatase family protein [Modestobacter sp. URMC 112]
MRLLFVCTGNICRSPVAAALMATWVAAELGQQSAEVLIDSAGVAAAVGRPMDTDSCWALGQVGGDPERLGEHRARRLVESDIDCADLVLTMTRGHRRTVLGMAPRALKRTFTVPEAAALLESVEASSIGQLPLEARAGELAFRLNAARARRRVSDGDDMPDPIGRPAEVHLDVAARIALDLRPLAEVLFSPLPAVVDRP